MVDRLTKRQAEQHTEHTIEICGKPMTFDEETLASILGFSKESMGALTTSNTEYFEGVPQPEPLPKNINPDSIIFAGLGIAIVIASGKLVVQLIKEKRQIRLEQLYLEKDKLKKEEEKLTRWPLGPRPKTPGDKGCACIHWHIPEQLRVPAGTNLWVNQMDLGLDNVNPPHDRLALAAFDKLINGLATLSRLGESDATPALV